MFEGYLAAIATVSRRHAQAFTAGLLFLATSVIPKVADAQVVASPSNDARPVALRMFIEPSATTVSLGKASLKVSPLTYRAKGFIGEYKLTVVPYFFKSETGILRFEAPDVSMQGLSSGSIPVKFIGSATSLKDGNVKVILGKAIPITTTKGSVTVRIITEHGLMVFNTSYHLGE